MAAEEKGWNSKTANLQFSIVALPLHGEWASWDQESWVENRKILILKWVVLTWKGLSWKLRVGGTGEVHWERTSTNSQTQPIRKCTAFAIEAAGQGEGGEIL